MSLLEVARKILPKGYQPTQQKSEANSLFQKIRVDYEKILSQYGTRVPHKMNRITPFPYLGALFYRLTPWQVGDGIKLITELRNPEDKKKLLTITLESPYLFDPKKAPSLILRIEEADTYLVIFKNLAIIRDKNGTIRTANAEDLQVYQEVADTLKQHTGTASDPRG